MGAPDYNPFSSRDTLRELGEVALIRQIQVWLGSTVPAYPIGIGDDCAVVDSPIHKQILTTDSLTYGHHFDDTVRPEDAGSKLVKRNLSDIAAMGGTPDHALLTILSGADLRRDWLESFIQGIRRTCRSYDVALVGGDVSSLPEGHFSAVLCLSGHLKHLPLLRRNAKDGDTLYVTGTLGGSIRGKHYNFEPRLPEGQWLAEYGVCSAMMDLTDGLAKDLRELLPEGCQALLELDRIPLSKDATHCAVESGHSTLQHAFCDGEDYELLFAIKGTADLAAFEQNWQANFPNTPLARIGRFCPARGDAPYLDAQTKEALPWLKGFEHLNRT
jgi:thiamine-monophosphate kinase